MAELKINQNENGDYVFSGDEHITTQTEGVDLSNVDLSDYNVNLDVLYRLFDRANAVQDGTSVEYEEIQTQDGVENGEATETDYVVLYSAMKQKVIERNELAKQKLSEER